MLLMKKFKVQIPLSIIELLKKKKNLIHHCNNNNSKSKRLAQFDVSVA